MNVLCFESGGTKLVAALADSAANLTRKQIRYRDPDQHAQTSLQQLCKMGAELCRGTEIEAIGFGFGGTVERLNGQPVKCYHETGWEEVDLRASLRSTFGVPVFVENDCNLAALAEACLGVRLVHGTLFYVTLGTGIGGGIVSNQKLLELGGLGEAEIGHIIVEPDGPQCPCGNRGCLETLCSGPGLSTLAHLLIGRRIDAKKLMGDYQRGEATAGRVIAAAAQYLGTALAHVHTLIVPAAFVLGGGVMKANQPFLNEIREQTLTRIFPPFRKEPAEFLLSQLQEDVVSRGAALFALQKLAELEPEKHI